MLFGPDSSDFKCPRALGTLVFEFQDRRVSLGPEERYDECDVCGTCLVLLPNDKRECRCFDCLRIEFA